MLKVKINSLLKRIFRPIVLFGKRRFYEEVIVLGDSHAVVFYSKKFRSCFPNHFFTISIVEGATVSGLQNSNSKTQALPIFIDSLKNSKAGTTIVLLGEVDTGFVIWYRAEKYKTPVEPMLDSAIENYQHLLRAVSRNSRVICLSAPLPTIQDGQNWGEIANARKRVNATQLQRTELTIWFNKRMQEFCEINGFLYLSYDDESLGEKGIVSKHLLNSNPNNHHYDRERYTNMIIDKLRAGIKQGALPDGNSDTLHCRR